MQRYMVIFFLLISICLLNTSTVHAHDSINESIRIQNGEKVDKDLNTVNGSIFIGKNASVEGDCHTVNGQISLSEKARTGDLNSVNGQVEIDSGSEIQNSVSTVNGSISIRKDCQIKESVTTVNGQIELRGVHVEKNVETVNGNIKLEDHAKIEGDIVVHYKSSGKEDAVEINISGGSVVKGNIIVEDEERGVIVRISSDSRVNGEIRNAQVEKM
ncbi:MAG: hypothetical protein WAN36_10125 [Calditrichia bacterium]